MAVSGCEFVCKNDQCLHKEYGFVITDNWPMGDVDGVIRAKSIMKDIPFKNSLVELKKSGRKHVCIQLPDYDKIPVAGYRVQRWCPKCSSIWSYAAMIPEGMVSDGSQEVIKVSIEKANIPENCPTCNTKMQTFAEVIDDNGEGISCTSCKQRLQANVWWSNNTVGGK